MDRRTFQPDHSFTRHHRYPRWGRLAKTKDFRKVHAFHTDESSWFMDALRHKYALLPEDLYFEKGDRDAKSTS